MPEEFLLQKGEKVIRDEVPSWNLLYLWMLDFTLAGIVAGGIAGLFFALTFFNLLGLSVCAFAWVFSILAFVAVGLLISWLRFSNRHYWLTNQRVIYRLGAVGYKVYSVPLEKISDVSVSRSFLEELFDFGSVQVRIKPGEGEGNSWGAKLEAIPHPDEVQKQILQLMGERRTKLKP